MRAWFNLLLIVGVGCGGQGSLDLDVAEPHGHRYKLKSERGLEYDDVIASHYFIYEDSDAYVGFDAPTVPQFGPTSVWEMTLLDGWEAASVEASIDEIHWEGGDQPWSLSGTVSGTVTDGSTDAEISGTFSVRSMDCVGQLGITGYCGNISESSKEAFIFYASYPADGFYSTTGAVPEALASLLYAADDVAEGEYRAIMDGDTLVFPAGAELECEAFPTERGPEHGDQDVICGAELGVITVDGCEHTVIASASPEWFVALSTQPSDSCDPDVLGFVASLYGPYATLQ